MPHSTKASTSDFGSGNVSSILAEATYFNLTSKM